MVALHRAGEHSVAEVGDLSGVGRSTVYRAIQRCVASERALAPVWSGPHRPIDDRYVRLVADGLKRRGAKPGSR